MNRRTFLEASIATGVLATLPARGFGAMHRINEVGVQLYTVRDAMKADFAGSIAKVAAIGYKEVEFAGYFDHKPADVRGLLDKNGLAAPATHIGYDLLENDWPETLDAAHAIGHKFIVCPWIDEKIRKSPGGWKGVAEFFNKIGEGCRKAGIQFAYHNHTFEFVPDTNLGGKLPYDFLLENTDPHLVKMEMDLCWISVTGHDPVKYFSRFPGRFPLVHVKDVKELPKVAPSKSDEFLTSKFEEEEMTEAGAGAIDWKRIFAHADEAGTRHFFVEHDSPKDGFASIAASYKYLAALRF